MAVERSGLQWIDLDRATAALREHEWVSDLRADHAIGVKADGRILEEFTVRATISVRSPNRYPRMPNSPAEPFPSETDITIVAPTIEEAGRDLLVMMEARKAARP